MDTVYLHSPIGSLEIKGTKEGLASVHFLNSEEESSTKIPNSLKKTVKQLEEYFLGIRTEFNLKLNPNGTEF